MMMKVRIIPNQEIKMEKVITFDPFPKSKSSFL